MRQNSLIISDSDHVGDEGDVVGPWRRQPRGTSDARPWTHFLHHPPSAQGTNSKMSNILPLHYSGRPASHAPPASTSQTSSTSTIRPHAHAPPQFTVARGQGATMSGNQSQGPGLRYPSNKKSIYDRNLNRSKNSELSRAAFAYLFIEMIAYAQKGAKDVGGLEQKYVMELTIHSAVLCCASCGVLGTENMADKSSAG
jgi:hypothetical protein